MPKICSRYTQDMPKICSRFARDMPEKYAKKSWGKMSTIILELGQNAPLPKFCAIWGKVSWSKMSPSQCWTLIRSSWNIYETNMSDRPNWKQRAQMQVGPKTDFKAIKLYLERRWWDVKVQHLPPFSLYNKTLWVCAGTTLIFARKSS